MCLILVSAIYQVKSCRLSEHHNRARIQHHHTSLGYCHYNEFTQNRSNCLWESCSSTYMEILPPFFCLATAVFSTGCYIWRWLQRLSLESLPHSFQFLLSFALPLEILCYVPGIRRHIRVMQSHMGRCRSTGHFWGLRAPHVLSMCTGHCAWTAQPLWHFPV